MAQLSEFMDGCSHFWDGNLDGGSDAGVRLRGVHLGRPARPAAAALGAAALAPMGDGGRERVVVIDTGPDFREQALRNGSPAWTRSFTHSHADHILGMDDLRPLSFTLFREGGPIPLYASPETARCWSASTTTPFRRRHLSDPRARSTGAAGRAHSGSWRRVPARSGDAWGDGDCRLSLWPRRLLTDVSAIPESSFALLEGLDHLVLSALRHKPHPATPPWSRRLGWARRIGARQTWLTHIAHELGHEETNRALPDGIRLAYDGLSLPVSL
jgi:phosphoribosyl 1,2-cyclic phosphate phosphodiesterase